MRNPFVAAALIISAIAAGARAQALDTFNKKAGFGVLDAPGQQQHQTRGKKARKQTNKSRPGPRPMGAKCGKLMRNKLRRRLS